MEDLEIIKEFLVESNQNLAALEQEMVELEQKPGDTQLLGSVFRTIHTIKGTCGFLGFNKLEKITHHAESILSQLRAGERPLTPRLVTLILDTVDAIKKELVVIETTGSESADSHSLLFRILRDTAQEAGGEAELLKAKGVQAPEAESAPANGLDAPAVEEKAGKPSLAESTIRIDVALADRLMNLVGELVLVRNQVLQAEGPRVAGKAGSTAQRMNLITTELQETVMKTRMQPIGGLWSKLPRLVRDISSALGKQIRLVTEGAEVELDRSVLEAIKDPLLHIVRNSCDHGIETVADRVQKSKPAQGLLTLRSYHEAGQAIIEIADDGAGINPEKVKAKAVEKGLIQAAEAARMTGREAWNLIFLPGFSTAAAVTNISGRGVGMDVVRRNLERIGGVVDIHSEVGVGTTMRIKIPLTLAILPGLVVEAASEVFVIPQSSLAELLRLEGENLLAVETLQGISYHRVRGRLLPLVFLSELLGIGPRDPAATVWNVVVVKANDNKFGLVVDRVVATREIVVKPLGCHLKRVPAYAGATIMGDGRVALILDASGLAKLSGLAGERPAGPAKHQEQAVRGEEPLQQTLLLFQAGRRLRIGIPLSLVARLETFPLSKVEDANGAAVIQYRDRILPLVSLAQILDATPQPRFTADPVTAIVIEDCGRRIGLVVDSITDVKTGKVASQRPSNEEGILCSAVFHDRVTDLLNLPDILRKCDPAWYVKRTQKRSTGRTILLAEQSSFARSVVRSYLELAGHHVIEAQSADEAMARLKKSPIDAVLTSSSLPPDGATRLAGMMRAAGDWRDIPVIALFGEQGLPAEGKTAFSDMQHKFDRKGMLRSLDRLMAAIHDSEQSLPCAAEAPAETK